MFEFQLSKLCNSALPLSVMFLHDPLHQVIHRHDAIELVYILHGAGWCAVDGVIHPMSTGDLYVIPTGATHEYCGDTGLHYVNCLFNQELFREEEQELYQHFLSDTPDHLVTKYTFGPYLQKDITTLFEKLYAELQKKQPYHLISARSIFIQMIIFIIRNATHIPGIQASASQKQLGRVLSYISDHLAEKITIHKLAEIAGYRDAYLPKLFYKEIGCGISKYIQGQRLERAVFALEHTTETVEVIAYENGFFDASYFVKVFRKRFKMSPSQYRERANRKF